MPERHTPNTASYLLFEREGQILLMKRKNTGYKDGKYSLVAGHVDKGENFRDAMIREAEEEVGVEIDRSDLETLSVMHRKSGEYVYVDVFFRVTEWKGEPTNEEPEKCSELKWADPGALPDDTIDYVEKVVKEKDEGLEYQEYNW